jgi:hypothetical protein
MNDVMPQIIDNISREAEKEFNAAFGMALSVVRREVIPI